MLGLGTVRFLLALAVLWLHADFVAFEAAQIAVLTFFYISGFLMERSFHRYSSAARFLVNRLLRLLPTFLLVSLMTWVIIAGSDEQFRRSFGFIYLRAAVGHGEGNVPPLGSFGSFESEMTIPYLGFDSELVPQAWSIGNEMVYYLTVPILAVAGMRSIYLLLLLALAFLGLQLSLRADDFDYEIYTNLLATFCIFLLGYLVSRHSHQLLRNSRKYQVLVRIIVIASILLSYFLDFPDSISPFLVIGYLLLLIPLLTVGYLSNDAQEGTLSRWLGRISYPLYLSHMISIGLLNYWSILNPLTALAASVLLATMLNLVVDGPIEKLRARVRDVSIRT